MNIEFVAIVSLQDDVYQVEYDGASKSKPGPAGAGALVRRPDGSVVGAFTTFVGVSGCI
jgi:ribonuclease HI